MRAIKFRGFSKKQNKWVYGYYALHHIAETEHGALKGFKPIPCIFNDEDDRKNRGYWDEVVPGTVGQFTGLTDANGVEIYEGDLLLSHENSEVFEVVYDAPRFCFKDNDFGFRFLNRPENFGVVGNIHDDKGRNEQ